MPAPVTPDDSLGSLDPEKWLTSKEVAGAINVNPSTLRSWLRRGQGPAFYRLGRIVRFRKDDVTDWLATRRRE